MKKFIFPVVFALIGGFGFTACGGGGDDGGAGEQQEELNCKESRVKRIEALQKKGELTAEEQAELDSLYAQLEAEAEDPNLTCLGGG